MVKSEYIERVRSSDDEAVRMYDLTNKSKSHREECPNPSREEKIRWANRWATSYETEYRVSDFVKRHGGDIYINPANWESFMKGDPFQDVTSADCEIYSLEFGRRIPVDIKSTFKRLSVKNNRLLVTITRDGQTVNEHFATFTEFGDPHNAVKILVCNPNQKGNNLFLFNQNLEVEWSDNVNA